MKLIDKKIRDLVIRMFDGKTDVQSRMLCDLNGIDFKFAKGYYPIAVFEREFVDNNRYAIYEIEFDNNRMRMVIMDVIAREMDEWNSSFSVRRPSGACHEETFTIPSKYYSEWTVEFTREFDRENKMFGSVGPCHSAEDEFMKIVG